MRFVFVDSKHNFFHWLITVFLRIDIFIVSVAAAAYISTLGFLLSEKSLETFLPPVWLESINLYTSKLPFFFQLEKLIFAKLGNWYKDAPSWWTMVVGLPLAIIGVNIFIMNLITFIYTVFSPSYNHAHCIFCQLTAGAGVAGKSVLPKS